MSSLQRRALAGFGWMLSGTGCQGLLRIVLMLALARLLGPEPFGVFGAVLVVVHLALGFFGNGIAGALAQRQALEERHVSAAFGIAISSGVLTSAALLLSAPWLQAFFGFADLAALTYALAAVPLLAAWGIVPDGLLRRELRFRPIATAAVAAYAIGYGIVGLLMAATGFGVWALAAALLAETTVRAAMLLWARPHGLMWSDREALRDILAFSGGMTLRLLGHRLAESVDNIVVGRALGAEALGLYGRAYQLVSVAPATLGRAMSHVMMPTMSKVQDDPARLAAAYLRSTGVVALVGLPGAAVLAVLAPEIVEVALGDKWLAAALPLRILAAGVFLRLMLQLAEALGTAAGSVYSVAWRQGAYAGAVLAGALAGASWGLPGVATGVLAAQVFAYLYTAELCLRITGLGWSVWLKAHLPGAGLAIACGIAGWIATTFSAPAWLTLLVAAWICFLLVLVGYVERWLGPDADWILQAARERVPRRLARA